MADRKLLYVNSSGEYQEHSESGDSLKMLSFKTANYELTDVYLGKLVSGIDAADIHIHDARYFRENEHIDTGIKESKVIQDLTYTADSYSVSDISIEYLNTGTAGSEVVSVIGNAISVSMQSGVSTATQIKTAVDAFPAAAALVDIVISGTGSNAQTAIAATLLEVLGDGLPIKTNSIGVIDNSFLDPDVAGLALGYTSGALNVNVDNASIEINSDALRVKADGINDSHIDWGTGANQVSAVDVPIADAGSYFTTDNVEAALQQLAEDIVEQGVDYTVGVGGVDAGDVVFISSNNTVSTYATITDSNKAIGLAFSTEVATATVKVAANDTVIPGVLSGATAGNVYYWTGSALSTTLPAGAGEFVIQAGVAKNATDLHVECRTVKRNA